MSILSTSELDIKKGYCMVVFRMEDYVRRVEQKEISPSFLGLAFFSHKVLIKLLRFWASLGGLWRVEGIDRLKSRYSGDRAPITLATLWGVTAGPKKEVEISFCSVLRMNAQLEH